MLFCGLPQWKKQEEPREKCQPKAPFTQSRIRNQMRLDAKFELSGMIRRIESLWCHNSGVHTVQTVKTRWIYWQHSKISLVPYYVEPCRTVDTPAAQGKHREFFELLGYFVVFTSSLSMYFPAAFHVQSVDMPVVRGGVFHSQKAPDFTRTFWWLHGALRCSWMLHRNSRILHRRFSSMTIWGKK